MSWKLNLIPSKRGSLGTMCGGTFVRGRYLGPERDTMGPNADLSLPNALEDKESRLWREREFD